MNGPSGRFSRGTVRFRQVNSQADISALVDSAREAHAESMFSSISFSAEKVVKIAGLALKDDKRHGIFIAERGQMPIGFAYFTLGEYHIGTDVLNATIHNINVSRTVRNRLAGGRAALRLFSGVRSWARVPGYRRCCSASRPALIWQQGIGLPRELVEQTSMRKGVKM